MSLLRIRDLRVGYRTPEGAEHVVLDVPALDLDECEQVALRGRSGSGKTSAVA